MDPSRPVVEGHEGADYYAPMTEALHKLLLEKQVLDAADTDRVIAALEAPNITWGARIVAEAWRDADYGARLLRDGSAAALELRFRIKEAKLIVVAHTPRLHNLIVCTLCSCYPRSLLGQPPWWYISKNCRARAVREPRAVLDELGLALPAEVEVRVHDSNADMRYLVLPQPPPGSEDWPLERLMAAVNRNMLIGTAMAGESPA
jgi:nitrile hydratase